IAAPVAKQVFTDIFNYALKEGQSDNVVLKNVVVPEVRGMKKSEAVKVLKEAKLNFEIDDKGENIIDMTPKPGYTVEEGRKIVLYTGTSSNYNKEVVVPNLKGYSKEKAVELLNRLGIEVKIIGSGVVSEQSISAGQKVNRGTTTVVLKLQEVGD
ncbi:MAG: PASTA domain-containing protein, partial [Clostridiaceae bacterium]